MGVRIGRMVRIASSQLRFVRLVSLFDALWCPNVFLGRLLPFSAIGAHSVLQADSGRTDPGHVRHLEFTCSSRVLTVDATVSANTQELEDSWDRTLGKSLLALAAELSGSQSWRARGYRACGNGCCRCSN